jgi:hypothetical protein
MDKQTISMVGTFQPTRPDQAWPGAPDHADFRRWMRHEAFAELFAAPDARFILDQNGDNRPNKTAMSTCCLL